jgi:1-acyl-sn-glycerol-3-phosphate acyltransferase
LLQRLCLYLFHAGFARPVLHGIVGIRYRGRYRIPPGACLVVSNHNSHLDAAVLMGLFPLRRLPHVHPVAAADYFGTSPFKRVLAMWFMNGVPIERKPARGADPLAPIVELLERGESLVFFPEGSRGEAGVVATFRPGVGLMAQALPGLLVVPVFISGPERIWPRGEVVPVPLSIDANVGHPRSYPADLDARAIAALVRSDVLALAPPPPPVPGAPAAPPVRVAIVSVDTALAESVARATVIRLGRLGPTAGLAETFYVADGDGVREAESPVPVGRSRAELRLLSALFRTRDRFRGARFVELVERAQVDEALDHAHKTRFVVQVGSPLVDLLAGSRGDQHRELLDGGSPAQLLPYLARQKRIPWRQWWRFLRHAPEIWLINVFNLVHPPLPDLLVLLRPPVPRLMERLRAGGQRLAPFQNEERLTRLAGAQSEVADLLRKRRRLRVIEVPETGLSPAGIAADIEAACLQGADEGPTAAATDP